MNIKLIALDLDGTTFNSAKEITDRTKKAIMAAIEQGVIVMPCTGRPAKGLPESFTSIPGVRYALTSNGGAIVDLEENKTIYGDYVPEEKALFLIREMLQYDSMVDIYVDGRCIADQEGYHKVISLYENMPEWFRQYVIFSRETTDDLLQFIEDNHPDIEKILASFDDMSVREKVWKFLNEQEGLCITNGLSFNIEINADSATKGNALLKFGQKFGIRSEEIMACGDATNDCTMLEAAGFAVAMANACPEIKALADHITLSNDEDGVAVAIEEFVLKQEA